MTAPSPSRAAVLEIGIYSLLPAAARRVPTPRPGDGGPRPAGRDAAARHRSSITHLPATRPRILAGHRGPLDPPSPGASASTGDDQLLIVGLRAGYLRAVCGRRATAGRESPPR